MHNGETVTRDWLAYSPSTGHVYCVVCKLFSTEKDNFSCNGFNDWKHSNRIVEHEQSKAHKINLTTFCKRKSAKDCIDSKMIEQHKNEQRYWIQILHRICDVIKFLASRGLAFRGENQHFGSFKNGNYLGILELLSLYDPVLKQHIETYGNKGKGVTSYLSANICEEFIEIMGEKVFSYIIAELKKSKYYSFSVDSTPDIAHVDQLSFTVRYIVDCLPVERFLMFIPIERHGAEYLANTVFAFLEVHDINIHDCRGQSYDNASNMSGPYSGLQTRIRDVNKYAEYIPCAAHSLNLVGVKAVECVTEVIAYFGIVQKVYTFFSLSTYRWNVLLVALGSEGKTLKALSTTRWSARQDAIDALRRSYTDICRVLHEIALDDTQPKDTRNEAISLCKKLKKFNNVFLTIVWNDFLSRINDTSKTLQKETMNLYVAVCLLKSLWSYLCSMREKFDDFYEKSKNLFEKLDHENVNTPRQKKRSVRLTRNEGPSSETNFTAEEQLKVEVFLPIIDSLCSNLQRRLSAYEILNNNFKFFTVLQELSLEQINDSCKNFAKIYDKDVSVENLISECVQLKYYLIEIKKSEFMSIQDLYLEIQNNQLTSAFPNVEICLRIFLSLMITNCSGERSFSHLKFIKNELRSTMTESRLNSLSIMNIESEILNKIDFNDIITDFAGKKSRRKLF